MLGWEGLTQFAQQLVSAVTAPPLVGCVVWSPVCECHRRHQWFPLYFSRHYPGLTERGVSAKLWCGEQSVEIIGNMFWGRYLSVIKSDGFFLSIWRWFAVYWLYSSPQFGRICPVVHCLHELFPCVSLMFVVLVISSFICCSAGEVGSLDLRSTCALIFSNISAGTGSVLIRSRPEGICRDAAFRMMVHKIFPLFFGSLMEAVFCSVYLPTISVPVCFL